MDGCSRNCGNYEEDNYIFAIKKDMNITLMMFHGIKFANNVYRNLSHELIDRLVRFPLYIERYNTICYATCM